ncbi:MAG: hypothetical protein ACOC8H_02550, partial [bacterium]
MTTHAGKIPEITPALTVICRFTDKNLLIVKLAVTVLRWAEDQLAVWRDAGVGWALWNPRGSFGIIDSNREDVDYEEF